MSVDEDMYNNSSIFPNVFVTNASSSLPSTVDPTIVFGPQRDSLLLVIPITIIYISIFFSGIIGNIFTCIVITRNNSMHTATNYYLFSLAISDLLLLVCGMPQEIYSIWSRWPYVFGPVFCVIRGLAAETSTNASILTITLFTIERYVAICHPFQSHQMSKLSRALKHIGLLWVISFALALPQALQFGLTEYKGVAMCLQTRVIIEHSFELSTFVFFLLPMVVITAFYALIGLKLNKTSKSSLHNELESGTVRNRRIVQSTRRVVKMLIAVVVAFFVCWAPFHAQRLVAIYGTNEHHKPKSTLIYNVYAFLTYISGVFYYMSTCINPILYHIMCNKFKEAFKNTIAWFCWCSTSPEERSAKSRHGFARVPSSIVNNSGHVSIMRQDTASNLHASIKRSSSVQTDVIMSRKLSQPLIQATPTNKSVCTSKYCSRHRKDYNETNNQNSLTPRFNADENIKDNDHKSKWLSLNCTKTPKINIEGNNKLGAQADKIVESRKDELATYIEEVTKKLLKQDSRYN